MENQPFSMICGDTKILRVTVLNDDGTPTNLTGAQSISWVLAVKRGATTALVTKSIGSGVSITSAVNGQCAIRIESIDTDNLKSGGYWHECKLVDSSGDVSTIFGGVVTMTTDTP